MSGRARRPQRAGRALAALAAAALALGALVAAGASAVGTVRQNEQGVVLRFGRVARVVPAGMCLKLPWPLERLVRVPTTEVRTMPIGYRLVDRVQGRPASDEERQWLTGDTNIVELEATLQYTVDDPVAYLFGAAELADGSPPDFVLRKLCEAALTRITATLPVDQVLSTGKQELARRALREVRRELEPLGLGLSVSRLNVVSVDPPADVIGSFNDVTTARADRERNVTEARGYERRILPGARAAADKTLQEAETFATALVNRAQGAAEAFRRLATEAAAEPALARRRLWLSALERILPRVRVDVVPPAAPGARPRPYYVQD